MYSPAPYSPNYLVLNRYGRIAAHVNDGAVIATHGGASEEGPPDAGCARHSSTDGAGNFRFLWQIVVPLSGGSISAFAIFSFLGAWSQYLWPLIITNETEMRTVQIGIRFFLANQERGTNWGALMAGAVIVLLPTLLIFLIANRQLVKGIAMTGLKG